MGLAKPFRTYQVYLCSCIYFRGSRPLVPGWSLAVPIHEREVKKPADLMKILAKNCIGYNGQKSKNRDFRKFQKIIDIGVFYMSSISAMGPHFFHWKRISAHCPAPWPAESTPVIDRKAWSKDNIMSLAADRLPDYYESSVNLRFRPILIFPFFHVFLCFFKSRNRFLCKKKLIKIDFCKNS